MTVNAEYVVLSVISEPARRILLQIVTDDDTLGFFDSANFTTVDGAIPESWIARIGENGIMELAPRAWLTPGFWEAYYGGDRLAIAAVDSEIQALK